MKLELVSAAEQLFDFWASIRFLNLLAEHIQFSNKFQPAVLFNNGPTSLGYVIILEEGGIAQELKDDEERELPPRLSSCITASPNQVTEP